MKYTQYYFYLICIAFLQNCSRREATKIELFDYFKISWSDYSSVSGMESHNETFAENDSVFYYNYKMYKKGKLYHLNDSLQSNEIIKKYNLKKIKNVDFFKYNMNNYKDHFSYLDCGLQKKIDCDSGYATTLKTKEHDTYQFIDLKNKPMLLQICSKGKVYKFNIEKKYPEENKNLGNGNSNAFLYDIDKDGKEEFIVVFSNSIDYILYAQVYKIKEN